MEGEEHFDELNWENDEGTLKEGHNSLSHYPTNAHYQRMEDIHDAKSDLSKGSGMYLMFSYTRLMLLDLSNTSFFLHLSIHKSMASYELGKEEELGHDTESPKPH